MRKKPNLKLRKYRNTLLFLFILVLFLVLGVHLTAGDRLFSKVENRNLKQRPVFSLAALSDGSYAKDLTGYLEDQFPLRDQMIRLKAGMEKLLLRQENNDVYINSGDYLIGKFNPNPQELTRQKAEVLNAFAREHRGVGVSVMLVPNKIQILKDKLPKFAPAASQEEYLNNFYKLLSMGINKINLIPKFTAQKSDYLYFRSDHHWTQNGAFSAQEEYLKALGLAPRTASEYSVRKVAQGFEGSLASKSGVKPNPADELDLYVPNNPEDLVVNLTEEQKKLTSLYQMDLADGQDKYLVYLGGNYPVVRIGTSSTKDRRLLIIKDSYANAFVPFMTRDFNEITMVDLRYYTGDINQLVNEYLITDVLVLYNINTFNDDNSILNIGDTLDYVPATEETAKEETAKVVQVSSRMDTGDRENLYVTIRNKSAAEIKYRRRFILEVKEDNKWVKVNENPSYQWDEAERTLGPNANAEYLTNLTHVYGALQAGTYRIRQPYNTATEAAFEFKLTGNP